MRILECLKKQNRTLLEMHLGMLFYGLICQIIGAMIVKDQGYYALSLWFGILMAAVSAIHMYHSLERALIPGMDAQKLVFRDFLIRYMMVVIILLLIIKTQVMNPLVVFLAYMSLKITALIQPYTHKLCNFVFHETDPVAQPMVDETQVQEQEVDEEL